MTAGLFGVTWVGWLQFWVSGVCGLTRGECLVLWHILWIRLVWLYIIVFGYYCAVSGVWVLSLAFEFGLM